jgi:hypothetical protein
MWIVRHREETASFNMKDTRPLRGRVNQFDENSAALSALQQRLLL